MRSSSCIRSANERTDGSRSTDWPQGHEIFWVQEEPTNMGAWPYMKLNFGDAVGQAISTSAVSAASSRPAPAPAAWPRTGSSKAELIAGSFLWSQLVENPVQLKQSQPVLPEANVRHIVLFALTQLVEVLLSVLSSQFGAAFAFSVGSLSSLRRSSDIDRCLNRFASDPLAVGAIGEIRR